MNRREALFFRIFAVWTVYVWGTRIWNVIGDDDRSFGFKAVHVVLALISVGFAVGAWWVVGNVRRRERAES